MKCSLRLDLRDADKSVSAKKNLTAVIVFEFAQKCAAFLAIHKNGIFGMPETSFPCTPKALLSCASHIVIPYRIAVKLMAAKNESGGEPCPRCGKELVVIESRLVKWLTCPGCKFKKLLPIREAGTVKFTPVEKDGMIEL